MSIKGFFNQEITLYPKSSRNRYGRVVIGSGTDYNARFQKVSKSRLLPNGQTLLIAGIMYAKSGLSININDRVDYGTDYYKVWGKTEPVDGQGNVHHLKLELIKWVET